MALLEDAYEALLGEIFTRFPSVQKDGFSSGAYKPGLERMYAFNEALGRPDRALHLVHVAGTNGKGSVSSLLASALSSSGYRTGLYTSPHLVDFRERLKIVAAEGTDTSVRYAPSELSFPSKLGPLEGLDNGVPENPGIFGVSRPRAAMPSEVSVPSAAMVPKEYVYDFLMRWGGYFREMDLSFFEITTGMALRWFADEGVDFAVMEVGLGGRLDSTNIIVPEVSVVTGIGLDHMALLGDTRPEIAAEKAGIFKDGVPAVVASRDEETESVFRAAAKGELIFADEAEPWLWDRAEEMLVSMDLQAKVQRKNLRTALWALDVLRRKYPLDGDAVRDGIVHAASRTGLHGRWEMVSRDPRVIMDIGHNADALRHNFSQLREMAPSRLVIVYGIMADKDLDAIIPLMPSGAEYIFTTPSTPRALPSEDILRRFEAAGRSGAVSVPSVREAVLRALSTVSGDPDALVYIGGSTFVVSEAASIFENK